MKVMTSPQSEQIKARKLPIETLQGGTLMAKGE
jgi:hypothetical protein